MNNDRFDTGGGVNEYLAVDSYGGHCDGRDRLGDVGHGGHHDRTP